MNIKRVILERAGLSRHTVGAKCVDESFINILQAMESLHRGKSILYGSYVGVHGKEPKEFAMTQHFCDIKRKYVRAENYIKKMSKGEVHDIRELVDTYADLAVYAMLGLQLIEHYASKPDPNCRECKGTGQVTAWTFHPETGDDVSAEFSCERCTGETVRVG